MSHHLYIVQFAASQAPRNEAYTGMLPVVSDDPDAVRTRAIAVLEGTYPTAAGWRHELMIDWLPDQLVLAAAALIQQQA